MKENDSVVWGRQTSLEQHRVIHIRKLVTLIGDLDKLEQNKEAKREYLAVLSQVNNFMDKSK